MAVVCSIGLDHRDWLGDTLEQIGAEKAGIFRPGRPAVLSTADMPASVYCDDRVSSAPGRSIAGRDFSWQIVATARVARRRHRGAIADCAYGAGQSACRRRSLARSSIAMPLRRLRRSNRCSAGYTLNERTVSAGACDDVRLAGRFQVVPDRLRTLAGRGRRRRRVEWILDIAHNEPAARVFARALCASGALAASAPAPSRSSASWRTRTRAEIAAALDHCVDHWVLCTLPGPRGSSAADLANRLRLLGGQVTLANSVEEGCESQRGRHVAGRSGPGLRLGLHRGSGAEWLRRILHESLD